MIMRAQAGKQMAPGLGTALGDGDGDEMPVRHSDPMPPRRAMPPHMVRKKGKKAKKNKAKMPMRQQMQPPMPPRGSRGAF